MKRKRADIASFFNKKKPAEAQENERQGQMEKGQTDSESEGEESPVRPGPSGPPDLYKRSVQIQRAREMSPHVPVAQVDLQTFPNQEPINQSSHTRNSFPGHSRVTDEETFKPRGTMFTHG
ncbi:hypothetical protein JOQ06_007201 [Pogonophryne albipinna]|uniref:Uncharacterized protein n=1 Tax=Pogonophryne albipinna TaxID=1090488 RepID=A0AAD6FHS5_9TELE|nr:hypothetical protein JOQ06_007201 [Pogonophryne albipinna]